MRAWLIVLSFCLACDKPVAEDATGHLGAMAFSSDDDDCRPKRFSGSTGALFVGSQPNGRLVVTTSLQAFWGPPRPDAGTIVSGSRTDFVNGTDVEELLGGDPNRRCARLRYRWTDLGTDGGVRVLELKQTWQSVDLGCQEQYAQLPERDCTSVRRVVFTVGQPCRLQCLTPTTDDFTCGC